MMNSKLVSIIIPFYNAAFYLDRCLNSVYAQHIMESLFEVIVIDDGSTDGSASIARNYQRKYNNLRLIEKNNGGVSSARNLGISDASGKYLVFLDADDVLVDESLRSLISLSLASCAEVIVMRTIADSGENYPWNHLYQDGALVAPLDVINDGFIRGSVCGCAFLRNFINEYDICFPEHVRNGEDTIFFFKALAYVEKVLFKDILFYQVIYNSQSVSNTFSYEHLASSVYSVRYVESLIKESNNIKSDILWNFLKYILISNIVSTSLTDSRLSYRQLCESGVNKFEKIQINGIVNHRLKIAILNCSFLAFYYMARIKKAFISNIM